MPGVEAFEVVGEPVRRRILELLAGGESASGSIVAVIRDEFAITQPAVSQHLKVLRESGFATVRVDGPRRLYALDPTGLREVDAWLGQFRRSWFQPFDALDTELARGRRARRGADSSPTTRQTPTEEKRIS